MKTKFSGILTLLLAFVVQLTFAQEKTVSGTISDASGLPLPGATVLLKGTTTGTSSDFDGNYSIKANQGATLVFSFVGYVTTEVTVGASNTINITLKDDATSLEEVIVVAYGTQTRESIVGSVGIVSSETIGNQQVTSPLRALQGSVPGVNLLTAGGQPGNNPDIRIRGFSSINADQAPLIVLDGAAFNGNLNTISQDQIESISVLKDASSTSLYGSRGANGVILITTKKGKRNTDPLVSIRSQFGVSKNTEGIHDMVGSEDYMKLTWQALRNSNQYVSGQSAAAAATNATADLTDYLGYNPYNVSTPIDVNGNLVPGASLLWETNWEDEVFNNNVTRVNHNLNISGGSDKTTYFFSLDYLNEDGPVITSDFERVSTRLNLESQLKDWLKVGINNSFSRSQSGSPDQTSGSTTQAITWIYGMSSVYPVYARDANGNFIRDTEGGLIYDLGNGLVPGQVVNSSRPVYSGESIHASLLLGKEDVVRSNYVGNAYAEINIVEGLKFKTSLSYENYLFDQYSFDDDKIGAASNVQGRVTQNRDILTTLNAIQSLNYQTSFGNHNISIDAITEAYTSTQNDLRSQGTGFLPGQGQLGDASTPEGVGGLKISERLNSYLARVAYNFDKTYYLEFSGRRDGSTRFATDTRWGNFFSTGGSWIVSNESFLENSNVVDYLKLRASYGELGNNRGIGLFPYQSVFQSGYTNEGNSGILLEGVVDPLLSWEKTASANFGLDFNLFNGVLSGSVDYYNKESKALIYDVPLAPSTGVKQIRTNNGTLRNYGWEFALNSKIINKEDFSWEAGVNFSLDKNEIKELTQDQFVSGSKLWKEGNSLFDFYIQEWAGVDPADGFGMWFKDVLDVDGEVIDKVTTKVYSEATRYEQGETSLPDVIGGFTNLITYKQFDLGVLFNFSFGAYLLDTDYSSLINVFESPGGAAHPDNFKAWKSPGDITNVPLLLAANNDHASQSTRFLYKNDYIRLKSLTFGYSLPQTAIKRIGLSKVRLYAQADNIFTWQSHEGIEPEQAFSGVTNRRSPLQATTAIGVNIEF
ncbi:TonB-dependent Receptor Plug Domain protein [Mariniflexile rhizosphaerae]|uniref:SusC/RagA family TonB-linked outer membrane protein n=1 Tax=unclassified Mariniflexile TaxID=2643887 RepID=UPI000CB1861C|nr:TonB-dependent receptor [Mariniflexile sp. TRM1-10]AXP79592.1 TonB-dependent Receptor Plug Domain protein [Mariniflexile sp. TRM1-10]PLB18572.1 MAG: TonB-dependent receptor plug [Flavobacteriaceae bacterium FS1-H7996/R]